MELQERARSMRRNPTEPEKRLWRHLSNSQLGGFKFRRQVVIGGRIVDFLCPAKAFVVEVDGDTHSQESDAVRDRELAELRCYVLHVTNADVIRDVDAVLRLILHTAQHLPDRWRRAPPQPLP